MHARFRDLVDEASRTYDVVIVDVPPVLAVTDAAIVGRLAGTNFLVLRFAEHAPREIELTLKRLEQAGVRVHGVVMNAVTQRASAYGYHRYGYQYAYSYGEKK
jgi:tyrosine-protein kinase Etk/Wzc